MKDQEVAFTVFRFEHWQTLVGVILITHANAEEFLASRQSDMNNNQTTINQLKVGLVGTGRKYKGLRQ